MPILATGRAVQPPLQATTLMHWPDGFIWGTASSSTQSEGAAPASDWRA